MVDLSEKAKTRMAEEKHADIAWLLGNEGLGPFWGLSFVKRTGESEVLRRIGGQGVEIRSMTKLELMTERLHTKVVRVARFEKWVVAIEMHDCRLVDFMDTLSLGTEAMFVHKNVNALSGFEYVIDGETVTAFDPLTPDWREGSDPDLLVEEMESVGFDPHNDPDETGIPSPGVVGALALAGKISGAVLTPDILNGPLAGGRVR